MAGQNNAPNGSPPKGTDYLSSLNRDLKGLSASVLIITQKIKHLVRNEKILGRNLIVINKRVRELQGQVNASAAQGISEETRAAIEDLTRQTQAISQRLVEMEAKIDDVSRRAANKEDVKEIKYIMDNMNPLHFITVEQAKQMMNEKKMDN